MRRLATAAVDAATSFAKNLAILVAMVVAIWAAVHTWMALAYPDYVHRFRLTVEVDTPGGPRSGSSVIEVERKDNRWIPVPGSRYSHRVRGEAVFVDLGGGRAHPYPRHLRRPS